MKKILLIFTLFFAFSFLSYGVTFVVPEVFIKKYFTYDKKLEAYVYNITKLNTLSFNASKTENNEYIIQTIISLDKKLNNLKQVRFNNGEYVFEISDLDLIHLDNILLFSGFTNVRSNNLNKLIDFFNKGNVTLEYVLEDKIYKYSIDNKTCKIFSEILSYGH
ncbi:hypothetical protein [Brachyspira catarrhinii]|uniref:Uncharacterized protein n=1 Tax=Brachyspira catarrhinii TaxID=2528966 RepID=A0ABY2TRU0_9SPIR|nr:hypothetical protein [Brachyspira catarrhinii]TKZ31715.1 hypothetical protein EZH24_09730 [Brachyspira catarrhinii]